MCIFCEIIAGKVPVHKVYEDSIVLAFLDIAQVTKGHTLVIPKEHSLHMLTCEDDIMLEVMRVAKRVGQNILEMTDAKGLNVLSNVHEIAGQTVSHFHVHLIPRYDENDAINIEFKESQPQNLKSLAELLYLDCLY